MAGWEEGESMPISSSLSSCLSCPPSLRLWICSSFCPDLLSSDVPETSASYLKFTLWAWPWRFLTWLTMQLLLSIDGLAIKSETLETSLDLQMCHSKHGHSEGGIH
jgi:hypothetical protein